MNKNVILNFISFQICWFACVIGAAKQMPWLGVLVTCLFVVWHLNSSKNARAELLLLAVGLIIGGLFDQTMKSLNLVSYQSHLWSDTLVPAWILALWLAFTCTLNVSLRWMRGKWLVAVLFGAIGGPLAYVGAMKLGAVSLNQFPQSYIVLSVGWALITPLLLTFSQKWDGFDA